MKKPSLQANPITKEHIRAAVAFWKKRPGHGGYRNSNQWDVVVDGVRYPPKAIIAIANEKAGNGLITPRDFKGAATGKWHRALRDAGFSLLRKGASRNREEELGDDIAQIIAQLPPTEAAAVIQARIGQGKFRAELIRYWGGKCAVTGIACPELLRASHIRAWADCKDEQHLRLSPANGLLLSANLDCLFDQGLISFSDRGAMLISKGLKVSIAKQLRINRSSRLRIDPTLEQAKHLAAHRKEYGFLETSV